MSFSTTPARDFSLRLSLFFAALFVLYGVQLPFFPVWLDWRGLSPAEIGVVTAAPLFLRIVIGPVAAFLADRSGDRRQAIIIAAGCGLLAVLALSQ
jgi:PPP family 3-phenylpropionic acid transporter